MAFHLGISSYIGWKIPSLTQVFYSNFLVDKSIYFTLGLFFLGEYFNRFFYQISTYKYVQKLMTHLRSESFNRWLHSSLTKKGDEAYPMGEVMARIMSDTEAVRELVTSGSFGLLIDLCFVVSALFGFLQIDASIGWGLFAAEVSLTLALLWASKKMIVVFSEVRKTTGFLSRVVADVTNGFKELAYTPHGQYASRRVERVSEDFLKKQLQSNFWDASYYSVAESLYPILLSLLFMLSPASSLTSIALIATLVDLVQKSISPIKEIASKISSIQRAYTGYQRLSEFYIHLASPTEKTNHESPLSFSVIKSPQRVHISIEDFSYASKNGEHPFTLSQVKLDSHFGKCVAIVGSSGAGKSTLLKLLTGQASTFKGSIQLDDTIYLGEKQETLNVLSRYVSLIAQDSHLFSSTLAFNISLRPDYLETDLKEFWLQAENEIPYLMKWGLTLTSEIKPSQLSLGQKQLLAGLRALYLKKPIILFDEISSGLDNELEKALRRLVLLIQSQSLTFIVTHRLETILEADKVYVMAQGKVVQSGRPDELRNRPGAFVDLLESLKG